MRIHSFFIAGLAVVLCSCGGKIERAGIAAQAQTSLVGMTSEQILACMGIPAQKSSEGQTEVWAYNSGNNERVVAGVTTANAQGTSNGNSANATGVGTTIATAHSRYCVVNVVLRGSVVQAVNYAGPTGGLISKDEQCAYVVKNCIK